MNKQGTQSNPISIEQDQEIATEHQLIMETTRNKRIIQQAEMTHDPLDLCFAVIMTNIRGDLHTKKKALKREILQYFKEKIGINISCDHFQRRIQPNYSDIDATLNPCELILYGVDFLTTHLIKDRFTSLQTPIKEIVWINDSTCKLIYSTAAQAQMVINEQTKTTKIEEEDVGLPKGWFSIKPYQIFFFQRLLWVRYATTEQKNIAKDVKQAYLKFAAAKQDLGRHLLQKFNAAGKYKLLVEEIERKRAMERRRHRSPQRNNSLSRTREKYRNRSRFDSDFQENRRQQHYGRNRYDKERHQRHQISYRQPSNMNLSFAQQRLNRRQDNRHMDQNTSFALQYLDHNPNRNLNKSFNYNNPPNNNRRNLNLSFQRQERVIKKVYDVAEIDSEMSFNHFGSIRNQNQREDFNCDFNQDQKRSLYGRQVGVSFIYEQERQKGTDFNTSFKYQARNSNQNEGNTSFNYNPRTNRNNKMNDSFEFDNQGRKKQENNRDADFWDCLNSNSVRQVNEQEVNNHNDSFQYDRNPKQSKKGQNSVVNQSRYNDDSY